MQIQCTTRVFYGLACLFNIVSGINEIYIQLFMSLKIPVKPLRK